VDREEVLHLIEPKRSAINQGFDLMLTMQQGRAKMSLVGKENPHNTHIKWCCVDARPDGMENTRVNLLLYLYFSRANSMYNIVAKQLLKVKIFMHELYCDR
jgi:hypothetical protein